jgi:hypothetical protein
MRKLTSVLQFALVIALAGTCQSASPQQSSAGPGAATKREAVVLELFTSEGCSSCPPADALLAKLEDEQPVPGAEVVALEEHVDYWDHQGWVDRFSSAQWTQRQEAYASGFRDHGVYTPELVVNGSVGFVGSHERDAYRAIASAASQPRTDVSVSLQKSEKRDQERITVQVGKLQGAQGGDVAEVWVAVTEVGLHSPVTGGENAGRDLRHAGVARWLHKAGAAEQNSTPTFTGESNVKLDSAWKRANLRVIAFVQEKRSRHILGATVVKMEP